MPKRSTANSQTLAPPILGINKVDPISGMDPMYAVDAINFVARDSRVELRDGESLFARFGLTSGSVPPIGMMATGYTPTGGQFFLASNMLRSLGTGGVVRNITAGGTVSTILDTGSYTFLTMGINYKSHLCWWTALDSASPGAQFVFKRYDGTTVTSVPVFVVPPSVNPTGQPCSFAVYRNALWWAQYQSTRIYATAPDTFITGTEVAYDVGMLLEKGGNLAFCSTIARGGAITDEYLVVVSLAGEVLVFSGSDYASTTWTLLNRFVVPRPWGHKSYVKYGRDLLILTVQGVISVSQIMEGGGEIIYVSEKITPIFNDAVWSSFNSYAGTMVWYPARNLIVCNLPYTAGTNYGNFSVKQLVMNTDNGSWWEWTMGQTTSLGIFGDALYFGKIDESYSDLYSMVTKSTGSILSGGDIIPTQTAKLRMAYNYFGDRSTNKQFVEARPLIRMSEGLTLTMGVDVDYKDVAPTTTVTDTSDTAYKLYTPRIGLQGIGRAGSIRIEQLVTTKRISIEAIEVIWNDGDV